jgi:hypothetical protein
MAKHYVWVHTKLIDFEGSILLGVFTTLTRAKKFLGGEWEKGTDGAYEMPRKGRYETERLEKMEVQ